MIIWTQNILRKDLGHLYLTNVLVGVMLYMAVPHIYTGELS